MGGGGFFPADSRHAITNDPTGMTPTELSRSRSGTIP